MREVFFGTSALMIAGAIYNWILRTGIADKAPNPSPGGAVEPAAKER
jgi:hypothetical protein